MKKYYLFLEIHEEVLFNIISTNKYSSLEYYGTIGAINVYLLIQSKV